MCSIGLAVLAACGMERADEEDVGAQTATLQSESYALSQSCSDNVNDVYAQPRRSSVGRHGDLVRCAKGRKIATDEISAALASRAFVGADVQNSVQLYRISYRTLRLGQTADVASALVALPAGRSGANSSAESDLAVDATSSLGANRSRAPLVVYAHGTVPYGTSCADSRLDPLRDTRDLELGTVIAFATHGFPVVMPDYAGFIAGSPVAGYLLSEDEAHSLLDATRAMQNLLQTPQDKVALVGHSQGGHAVLSAQALARSYGLSGELVGVAAFAPFWAVGRTMGAIVSSEFGFNTHDDAGLISFAIEYFYTHAELYDGTGRGAALFKPAVRPALNSFVSTCQFEADPSVLGATSADFFQADFLAAVGECGVFGGADCASGLASTWERRFRADRPKLDPRGAPVVMWQGALDAVIPTSLAKCAIDKITADLPASSASAKFTLCGDALADHESLESNNAAWVTSWIEARARRGAEPASCPGESALEGDQGPLSCMTPPGNDD